MMRLVGSQVGIDEALKDPLRWIPRGLFCYAIDFEASTSGETVGVRCPFWELRGDMPEFENGYCRHLGRGDWEADHCSLLCDECKECGVGWDIKFTLEEDARLKALQGGEG